MTDRIAIRLAGPAKIDGRTRQQGETVDIDPALLPELVQLGLIDGDGAEAIADLAPGMPGFDEAVTATAKALADAAVAAAVEMATQEVIADRDRYRARVEDAEAEIRSLQARNHQLEAEIAEMQDAAKAGAPEPATETPADAAPAPKGKSAKG